MSGPLRFNISLERLTALLKDRQRVPDGVINLSGAVDHLIAHATDAQKFLQSVDRKHAGQIAGRILQLTADARPHDSRQLSGAVGHFYLTAGEYRVIYRFDADAVSIQCVARRNDGELYRRFDRR
jgi:mRNA-degrading endonuclease RelE of RelBE toxin-antitoxin system